MRKRSISSVAQGAADACGCSTPPIAVSTLSPSRSLPSSSSSSSRPRALAPPPTFLMERFGTLRSRSPSSNFTSYVPSRLSMKILPG